MDNTAAYTAWQRMQYMHNMIGERSQIETLNNNRYPEILWDQSKGCFIKISA